MKIPGSIVGTSVGPIETRPDARWLMAYSAALGERDARCYDTRRSEGVLPHPLFPVCYGWPLVLAHVYSECARIWNPIHTDVSYALAVGLPGLILHGTATLALGLSALLARHEAAASEFELARADGERAVTRARVDLV